MTATLFVAGMSHRSAPVEVREALALEEDKLREVLAALAARGVAAELLILSTCNRVEVYGVAEAPGEARAAVFRALGAHRGMALSDIEPHLVAATDADVVRHAFRVAASLDSLVVGEPQILGQVKDAFALAQACRTVGPILNALMSQAFSVAKRVRTETEIGRLAVSVSSTAVELARKIFGSLEGKAVLLLGAGEMAELAARLLMEEGAMPLYVANRTPARARDLAEALAGTAVAVADVPAVMAEVDVVIACTAAPEPIVRLADARAAVHGRRTRPLFLIDLGVPRNVEGAVNDLDGVFCYDVDDLQQVVDANRRERQREAQRAEALVEREVGRFLARLRDVEVVPTIVSLRARLEAIRRGELEKALARLPGASEETRQVLEALSQAIVNKVLHPPIEKLRDSSRAGHGRRWIEVVSEVFGLRRTPGGRGQ
jgi:glutamyl-tRNA reductase